MSVVRDVLSRIDVPALGVYIVWQPVLDGDDRAAAIAAARENGAARVIQYWDENLRLGREMGAVLAIPPRPGIAGGVPVAWDVYLVYPAGPTTAGGKLPVPTRWLHQLSHLPQGTAQELEPGALEARLREAAGS